MARPGFVLEVDERTPPLLVHQGEGFRLQKFPLGSRVIYPRFYGITRWFPNQRRK